MTNRRRPVNRRKQRLAPQNAGWLQSLLTAPKISLFWKIKTRFILALMAFWNWVQKLRFSRKSMSNYIKLEDTVEFAKLREGMTGLKDVNNPKEMRNV
jgi:hypothetical protein